VAAGHERSALKWVGGGMRRADATAELGLTAMGQPDHGTRRQRHRDCACYLARSRTADVGIARLLGAHLLPVVGRGGWTYKMLWHA